MSSSRVAADRSGVEGSGRGALALLNVSFTSDVLPADIIPSPAVCSTTGAKPVHLDAGRSTPLNRAVMLVQCDDGELELYGDDPGTLLVFELERLSGTSLGTGVVTWRWLSDAKASTDYLLVASDDDTLELRTYGTDFDLTASLALVPDVAIRDLSDPAAPAASPSSPCSPGTRRRPATCRSATSSPPRSSSPATTRPSSSTWCRRASTGRRACCG